MNKFWNHYFLMNEAGGETGGEGDGGAAAPAGGEATTTAPETPNFNSGFMEDAPEGEAESEVKTDADSEKKDDVPGEKYDPEAAYADFKYELPEGYSLSEEKQQQYLAMAKEKGVKPEQLQTFVNEHVQAQQSQVDEYKGIVKGWEAEILADPEIGGDNFPTTKKNVNAACSIDGGKEFREVLSSTGLISNPVVVKYLSKLGTMINNDGLVLGGQSKNDSNQDIKTLYNKSGY